jgi:hypothetical protein
LIILSILNTDQRPSIPPWLLEYHLIGHANGTPAFCCTTEQLTVVVTASGSLVVCSVASFFPVGRSYSSGGSQYHVWSPRWAIVALPRSSFARSTAFLFPVDPVTTATRSSSHDRQPCSSSHLVSCSFWAHTVAIEVHRLSMLTPIEPTLACPSSSLNIQASSLLHAKRWSLALALSCNTNTVDCRGCCRLSSFSCGSSLLVVVVSLISNNGESASIRP